MKSKSLVYISVALLLALQVFAQEESNPAITFLWIALILIIAKVSSLVERLGQPAVLGELVAGIILGNLALVGIHIFEPLAKDIFVKFLAELGVVILLFQIGLESNIAELKKVGWRAFLVACVGVVVPFALGTVVVGPLFFKGLSFNAYLFLGAALTATSVGITARVFRDLGKLHTAEAKIVLGAAVIDDVLGLIVLAVVSAIATAGSVDALTVGWITTKAVGFLGGAIIIGQWSAPLLGRGFSKIHQGVGMKLTLAIAFGLVTAYLAQVIGLAPIVGAFAAGLVLDAVHFKYFKEPTIVSDIKEKLKGKNTEESRDILTVIQHHADKHVNDLIEPIGHFLVPLFFVSTGLAVNVETLFDPQILLVALGIMVAAVIGKVVAGVVAGKVDKVIVGVGMIPRGEVGLIFANMGKALGVIPDSVFSVIVMVVVVSTLMTPPLLAWLLKKRETTPV